MHNIRLLLLIISISLTSLAIYAQDTEIKDHPLLGQIVYAPDYLMVIEGNNKYLTNSEVQKDTPNLMTLGTRFSSLNFPSDGLYVSEVFPPDTAFKITQIYRYDPSFINSAFTSSYEIAILEKDNKQYNIALIINNEIHWQINQCSRSLHNCVYWRDTINHCLTHFQDNDCTIIYDLDLYDDNNHIQFPSLTIRPPYPESWVNRSLANFQEYAKSHPEMNISFNRIHIRAEATTNVIGIANTLLHFEKLKIKNVSIRHKN